MHRLSVAAAVVSLLLSSCSWKQEAIDQQKFDGVYRAGKGMEGATGVGVNVIRYRELLQAFATEVSIANDRAHSAREREMVGQYAGALQAYQDAGFLWGKKLDGAKRLSMSSDPEVRRIVLNDAYNINGTGSGESFSFEIDDAVQVLWRSARIRLSEANRIYTGEESREMPEPQ
jgi:hypothetical protein